MTNVYTNRTHAGIIDRESDYIDFVYDAGADEQQLVSLTMPLRSREHFTMKIPNTVHPVFGMNLPEGRLRESIERMFSKALPAVDDLTLLEIVGRSQIGRLQFAPSVEDLDAIPQLSLSNLLEKHGTESLFEALLERYAHYSGVAGVQPKVLARDDGSLADVFSPLQNSSQRITVSGTTHIVKFFDAEEYPALAVNEYLCLLAAKQAGIPIPNVWMSADLDRLIVERFDTTSAGNYMAFEDCCALATYQPKDKYLGSYEQVAKLLTSVIASAHLREDMTHFFRSFVLSVLVRNGDAHRKNFGVVYTTSEDVRLSPAYDIITTLPYLAQDKMALLLGGSNNWPSRKMLIHFGLNSCRLPTTVANEAVDQVMAAVDQTRTEVRTRMEAAPDQATANTLQKMLIAWDSGLASLAP
jgi:serine/threonine-protein kinase HipA